MRHVTEGDLHAYLDGGLGLYPSDEAERVRAHVEACETCRARLDVERELRERADTVLAAADPGPVEAPPFEEVRRRALETGRSGAPSGAGGGAFRHAALRIAATAVLAFGVGWMAGREGATFAVVPGGPSADEVRSGGSPAPSGRAAAAEAPVETEAVAPPRTDPMAGEDRSLDAAERAPAQGREATAELPVVAAQATPEAETPPVGAEPEGDAARSVGAEPEGDAARSSASDRVAAADSGGAGSSSTAAGTVSAEADPSAVPRELRSPSLPATGVAESLVVFPRRIRAAAQAAPRDEPSLARVADREPIRLRAGADARRLVVPGLDVVSVEWREVAPGVAGVLVVQRLASGGTLELRFGGLEDGSEPTAWLLEEELPEGVGQVVAPVGRGWVVARAPLDEARIRELLAPIS